MSADPGRLLQIGEVTDRVDLSLRTVRYYEEVGLVAPTARTEGGFRLYSELDVQRLLLIKSMKAFDLTLEDMGAVLEVLDRSANPGDANGIGARPRRGDARTVCGAHGQAAGKAQA